MFASMPTTPRILLTTTATSANSWTLRPAIETITGTPARSMNGPSFSTNPSTPGFWRPIAFSIPDGVSAIRGVGMPFTGRGVTLFVTMPPTWPRSTIPASS
jgi:hypothetical protein